jgi:hypothetical protein
MVLSKQFRNTMWHELLANISLFAAISHTNTHLTCLCHISMLARQPWTLDTGLVDVVDFSHGTMEFILYQQSYEKIDDYILMESPVLFIEDYNKIELLNQFGELWKPVFKKWFKDNFNYDIKTIDA